MFSLKSRNVRSGRDEDLNEEEPWTRWAVVVMTVRMQDFQKTQPAPLKGAERGGGEHCP